MLDMHEADPQTSWFSPPLHTLLKNSFMSRWREAELPVAERARLAALREKLSEYSRGVFDILIGEGYVDDCYMEVMPRDLPSGVRVALSFNVKKLETDGNALLSSWFSRGLGHSVDSAFSRAVGELTERVPFLTYSERGLRQACPSDLVTSGENFMHPTLGVGARLGIQSDEKTMYLWQRAMRLNRKKEVLVPAQFVYWNYSHQHAEILEPRLRETNTCGLASGRNREVAARNALYELIERDAFLIRWLNKLPPPRLEFDAQLLNETLNARVLECRQYDLEPMFFDLTLDMPVPAYLCVLKNVRAGRPQLSIGLSAGFDPEESLSKALNEALGLYAWILEHKADTPHFSELARDPNWRKGFVAQARTGLWARPDMFPKFSFLTEGEARPLSATVATDFGSVLEELTYVSGELRKRGRNYEPIIVDGAHPLLKKLSTHAARVIVPALVPMYLAEDGAVLSAKRIRSVPPALGLTGAETLNEYPHPFP